MSTFTLTVDLRDHGVAPQETRLVLTPLSHDTDGDAVVTGSPVEVTTGTDGRAVIVLESWLDGGSAVYRVEALGVRRHRAPLFPGFSFTAPAPGSTVSLASLLAVALVPDPLPPALGAVIRADLDRALSGWPYVPIPTIDPATGCWTPPSWLPLDPSGGINIRWLNFDWNAGGVPALPLTGA